jgi:hypothetical protein
MKAGYGGWFSFWNLHVWFSNLLALVPCFFPVCLLLKGIRPWQCITRSRLFAKLCDITNHTYIHVSCKSRQGQDALVILLWFVAAGPESPGQHIFFS